MDKLYFNVLKRSFALNTRAVTSVEYAIIAAAMVLVIVASVTSIGHTIRTMFSSLAPVL